MLGWNSHPPDGELGLSFIRRGVLKSVTTRLAPRPSDLAVKSKSYMVMHYTKALISLQISGMIGCCNT